MRLCLWRKWSIALFSNEWQKLQGNDERIGAKGLMVRGRNFRRSSSAGRNLDQRLERRESLSDATIVRKRGHHKTAKNQRKRRDPRVTRTSHEPTGRSRATFYVCLPVRLESSGSWILDEQKWKLEISWTIFNVSTGSTRD